MLLIVKKIKNKIIGYLQVLINSGIRKDTPSSEIKRIKLLNIFCWVWHMRTIIELLNDDFEIKPLFLSLFDFFIMLLIVITIQVLQYHKKLLAARFLFVFSIMCLTFFYANFVYQNENLEFYFMLVPGTALIFIDDIKVILSIVILSFILMHIPIDGFYAQTEKENNGNFSLIFLYFGVFIMINYFKNLNLKSEAALQNKTKELEELDKFKSQFFTNISHEIRTPLTLIKGEIDNLDANIISKQNIKTFQESTNKQINSITSIINTVLDLAKMESSIFTLKTKVLNISELLQKIYLSFEGVFAQKGISLLLESPHKNYFAKVSMVFIERAINNILNNALKYTDKGKVIIKVFKKKEYINITISDTGIGIPQKDIQNIFNRFYQINNDINQSGGSGIGLAFSKEIIRLHEGTITVKSIENEGSSFTITLPIAFQKNKKAIKTELATKKIFNEFSLSNKIANTTFLIVDDNADMRKYLASILENHSCLEADNGKAALEILKNNTVDFIITDYMMPKMNGLVFSKKLNELQLNIPVIMITAKTTMKTKLEILKLGVKDYMTKPFDKQELLVRIDNLLQNNSEKLKYNEQNNINVFKNGASNLLTKIEAHINSNTNYKEVNHKFLCEKFNVSKSSLYRYIKSMTGLTPKEYIKELQLQKAQRILNNNPGILLKQLALEVGFKHSSYFSEVFMKRFGYRPNEKNQDII